MVVARPGLSSPQAIFCQKRPQGIVRMTVAWDADDALMHLRAQAAHILAQALKIETPSVRRTLLQRSFELLRQAQVAEVGASLSRVTG